MKVLINQFLTVAIRRNLVRNLRQLCVNENESHLDDPLLQKPAQKILKVAIIGMPNAGKSSIINNLMDRKVCAASSKVHTTRVKATAVFTQGDSQIVFLDTPGLVNSKEQKKHNLESSFVKDINYSLKQADTIAVIHDVSNSYLRERLDIKILNFLENYNQIPSFLILNKIDILKSKRKLLEITRLLTENSINGKAMPNSIRKIEDSEYKGWPHFKEIFMVSALTGDGLEDVKNYLLCQAKPGNWLYSEEVWTDQLPEQIIQNTVKATFLDFLPQEIPYRLKPQIELLDFNKEGVITTVVLVKCPSKRIATLVAGASDGRLRQITEAVQKNLQDAFQTYVRLKILLESKDE
ncbi:GTPase Era, mitochondrial [Agrilus planipennis]|uniref:GTPase Era, mitochondrial n=1 Tax=Agrilus planipennis TaxID=224129 RepID=A0A7F5RMF5_AGRPL|nr:GTPase Era, mitochondrial [Agrilus planipennis]XP_025837207.1 GTPase Era, mitochondrial [Agrilus planipennis]